MYTSFKILNQMNISFAQGKLKPKNIISRITKIRYKEYFQP